MTSQPPTATGKPEAPSTLQQWFPGALWISRYQWGKFTVPDLIPAISVAARLVPESMGYGTVAGVFYADITAAAALSDTCRYANRHGVELSLARLHTEARAILESAGTIDELGEDRVFDTVRNAVNAATKQPRGATYASSSAPPQASD